jgi:hypothetical protein
MEEDIDGVELEILPAGDALRLEFALELRVSVGEPVALGVRAAGLRRTVAITGGRFQGPLLRGRVLPGGADWQWVEDDGLTLVDAHYAIETDDGVRIEVRNAGVRSGPPEVMKRLAASEPVAPAEYYFRTQPRFDPPMGKYDWLRRHVFVGSAERYIDRVVVRVWKVL